MSNNNKYIAKAGTPLLKYDREELEETGASLGMEQLYMDSLDNERLLRQITLLQCKPNK